MSERDSVDALLERAFEREVAGIPPANLASAVMHRLRRRQRLRTVVLATALGAGMITLAFFLLPALEALLADLPMSVTGWWRHDALRVAVTAIAMAGWLLIMDEELG